jgi:YesN/AraC family two-component response regulator
MKIYIKYMVSLRCRLVVKNALEELNMKYYNINLGEVDLVEAPTPEVLNQFREKILRSGLVLIDDRQSIIVEKIKSLIIEMVHYTDEMPRVNLSDYLANKIQTEYHKASALFSKVTGTTIEHFFILHRVERAKELLLYDELNLSEIAYRLHFSSVAHLSNQFKKITGLSPTLFKSLNSFKGRKNLEDL